jgi:hypothetical protein
MNCMNANIHDNSYTLFSRLTLSSVCNYGERCGCGDLFLSVDPLAPRRSGALDDYSIRGVAMEISKRLRGVRAA